MIKVRFAPSPTGYLHIGSARTALFNWLFARAQQGLFLLRVEDTDKKRSKKEFLDEILSSLKWLGIECDEKPYFQSKRLSLYKKYAHQLLDREKAYEDRGAIRFKVPKENIIIEDMVHGAIEFDNTLLEDMVIMKKDGFPTYNFACVVDDADMGITHVIRGDDHISNTPKQIPLYRALDLEIPRFAHVPLILGEDRSRLSKRHGATSIAEYKESGFLPEAILNYLCLLGWSPGNNKEIISLQDTIQTFSLESVNKTNAVFGMDKLKWVNNQYIKMLGTEKLTELLIPYLKKKKYKKATKTYVRRLAAIFRTRIKILGDFPEQAEYFFTNKIKYDRAAVSKFLRRKELKVIFSILIKRLKKLRPFDAQSIEKCCRDLITELGIGGGDLIHPVRVAITGKSVSPGLFDVIYLLGKDTTCRRLRQAVNRFVR